MNFQSDVYKNFSEMIGDASLIRRDPYYTYAKVHGKMVKVPRQPSQTTQITIDKIKAQRRLDKHFEQGGTRVSLNPLE